MKLLRLTIITLLLLFSLVSLAHPRCCANNASNYGLFAGLGGSYNSIENDLHIIDSDADPSPSLRSSGRKFAPLLQIGYYGAFDNCSPYRFGAKVFFKYLDFAQVPSTTCGCQPTYEIQHEYGFMLMGGHCCEFGTLYGGLGATWTNQKFGDEFNNVFTRKCESKFGFTAQVGITYDIVCGMFLDINYTYIHIPESTFNIAAPLKAKACVTIQEVMFSLNKSFNFF